LRYIKLHINEGSLSSRSFQINIIGTATGGEDRTITIENLGVEQGDATTANIRVDIL